MTTSRVSPPDAVHLALADARVRRRIEGIVTRRVRHDDVVHQVVCDALGSETSPEDPAEVPRWLFGITRHKVADHHRASSRRATAPVDPDALAGRSAPIETRSLLRVVMADAASDARGAETMNWLAREAAGERLDELAREVALPAATVRQRVSRMRRWLQKRWLHEALLVAAAGLVVLVLSRSGTRSATIVADPLDDSAAAAHAALDGRWHVDSIEPDTALDPARRALIVADAGTTTIEFDGNVVRFTSATHHGERRLTIGAVEHGAFEMRVVDAAGKSDRATATIDAAGRLIVNGSEGDWKGRVVLVR